MSILPAVLLVLIATAGGYAIAAVFTGMLFRERKIFGLTLPGLLPKMLPALAEYISGSLKDRFLKNETFSNAFLDPGIMQKLKPELEEHIDGFLKNKLPKAMPLLAGMMGEKTTGILKSAFLEEVESLFPEVMKSIGTKTIGSSSTEEMFRKKIEQIDLAGIEKLVRSKGKRQIRSFKLAGALAGAAIGLLQVAMLVLVNKWALFEIIFIFPIETSDYCYSSLF